MRTSKPIFVVGSPRSGTSILTWCLGQHSNIFVQEESNWMGHLAFQLEIAYRVGTARGERSQLSALGVQHRDFFATFGQTINDLILDHRERLETRIAGDHSAKKATQDTGPSAFQISRTVSDPKTRWVDGTPEYSFYINPLRKLFPAARFVHVVRDVVSVVRSMMNFQRTGAPLWSSVKHRHMIIGCERLRPASKLSEPTVPKSFAESGTKTCSIERNLRSRCCLLFWARILSQAASSPCASGSTARGSQTNLILPIQARIPRLSKRLSGSTPTLSRTPRPGRPIQL